MAWRRSRSGRSVCLTINTFSSSIMVIDGNVRLTYMYQICLEALWTTVELEKVHQIILLLLVTERGVCLLEQPSYAVSSRSYFQGHENIYLLQFSQYPYNASGVWVFVDTRRIKLEPKIKNCDKTQIKQPNATLISGTSRITSSSFCKESSDPKPKAKRRRLKPVHKERMMLYMIRFLQSG